MPSRRPPRAMLVPAMGGGAVTAPPATPWQLGLRRFWVVLAPLVPVLIDTAIGYYQAGHLRAPTAWVPLISLAIALWQAGAKAQKEQQRAREALVLQAYGLPMGESLPASDVQRALYTTGTLTRTAREPAGTG